MGQTDQAILLKCDTMDYHYIPLALGDYQFVITNSNKQRNLRESKYNERRKECEEGIKLVREYLPNTLCLGDVSVEQWKAVRRDIHPQEVFRRLEHVINENARVVSSTIALETGDLEKFGHFMMQSHESLRDLFEVTGTELDTLFDEARRVEGCIGTRMTGAGFGGCTVSLVHKDAVMGFEAQVTQRYLVKTGLIPTFYICSIGNGAREVKT